MAMSASTWMKNLLARIPGVFTRSVPMPFDVLYHGDICDSAFLNTPRNGNTLFKTHLYPTQDNVECLFRNGVEKILITYRDLRDVTVARYYRLCEFPKAIDDPRYADYQALGKEKALDHCLGIVGTFFVSWIRGWREFALKNPERYHFTRFEDLKNDTAGTFNQVLEFYGIKLSREKIIKIVNECQGKGTVKESMKAARVLPWGYSSNFRSGKIASWKEEFSSAHIKKCKELLGPTLIELGYEKDLNW